MNATARGSQFGIMVFALALLFVLTGDIGNQGKRAKLWHSLDKQLTRSWDSEMIQTHPDPNVRSNHCFFRIGLDSSLQKRLVH